MTPRPIEELEGLDAAELRELWPGLSEDERQRAFDSMTRTEREDFFLSLSARDQAELIHEFPVHRRRAWIRLLAPDEAVPAPAPAPGGKG